MRPQIPTPSKDTVSWETVLSKLFCLSFRSCNSTPVHFRGCPPKCPIPWRVLWNANQCLVIVEALAEPFIVEPLIIEVLVYHCLSWRLWSDEVE